MKTLPCVSFLAVALALGHLQLTAAEIARFRYVASVYADDKGVALNLPEGVACGGAGQVVVGDTGNDRLLRFTFRDKTMSGGSEIKNPQLSAPSRVHLNSKGDIYALDSRQRRIVHLSPEGGFKAVLAFVGAPPPATVVPKGFAIDSADNIYVLDIFSARVLVLNVQGQFRRALALPSGLAFGTDVAIDSAGTLLLLDSIGRRLYSAAQDASAFTPLGGDLAGFLPTLPASVTAGKGVVFVAEGTGSAIVSFGRDGGFLSRQLTAGATEGSLNHPSQMCISDTDDVFLADRDNSRIQVFRLTR